ncbi:MAG: PorP/SprF family type IX secretion system membrane protein [Lentimicrobiaceae bacterium]|nr:PorP/SprF family type IX secretion system membrane protein [Lentimicrobiaceae bacterium]
MILYKRKFSLLLILFFFTTLQTFGQDPHFSQFYANPLYLNPAFAGTVNGARFSLNFRDQWPTIPSNFVTFSASYDQHINAMHGGIGVLLTADVEGKKLIQTYDAGAIYNFRAQVTREFNLQFAVQAGCKYTTINWDKLTFADGSSGIPTHYDNTIKPQFNVAVGMVGYTPYLYFGLAVHHLAPIQINFRDSIVNSTTLEIEKYRYNLGLKWTAHLGGKITIKQKVKDEIHFGDIFFYPNIVFISQGLKDTTSRLPNGTFHYLHEGFYFNFYPFTMGAWIRHNFKNLDAFIVTCGIEYKIFRIGYSYDFNLSKLEGTGGAHEVSLQFFIPYSPKAKSARKKYQHIAPVDCPRF